MMQDAEQWLWRLAHVAQGTATPVLPAQPTIGWEGATEGGPDAQHVLPPHLYRVMLEQLPVVTFLANLNGGFNQLYVSPQIEALLGYTQQEWVSNPVLWYEALHPDDRSRWNGEFSRFLMLGEPFSGEYRFLTRHGQTVWVRGEIKIIHDEQGRPIFLQGIGYDVTDRIQADQRIRQSLREKETLLKEIHHRVKNNLAVVSSLFYLQSTYVQDEATVKILRESQDRVRSMALVHEALYRSEDLAVVDFAEYAEALAQQLLSAYALPDQQIRLTTSLYPMAMKLDQAVPCGLILNELITNALKHAFASGRHGEIHLGLRRANETTFVLTVRDNGPGLPPSFDPEQTSSLGFRLIRALTRQIDGQFELVSLGPGPGEEASANEPVGAGTRTGESTGTEGRLTLHLDETDGGA